MHAVYHLNVEELDDRLLKAIKAAFRGQVEIIVRPSRVEPGQEWFWSPAWQAAEREVEEDLAAGRYETFDNMEDFIASLEPVR